MVDLSSDAALAEDRGPSRVVVDTNVLVAALLTPGKVADQALHALVDGDTRLLYDAQIVAEYRAVLARPKFASIDRRAIDERIAGLLAVAECVVPKRIDGRLDDEDDRIFLEVALGGGADAIVTGNAKHFPTNLGFAILSPGRWLELSAARRRSDG